MNVFYEKLHPIWQLINILHPCKHTNLNEVALHQQALDTDRVYDFFRGPDPQFDLVRSLFLAMNPVSPILEAYTLVIEEDNCQSFMIGNGSVMGVKPY